MTVHILWIFRIIPLFIIILCWFPWFTRNSFLRCQVYWTTPVIHAMSKTCMIFDILWINIIISNMCSTVRCSEYTFEAAVLKNKATVQLRENLLNCTKKTFKKACENWIFNEYMLMGWWSESHISLKCQRFRTFPPPHQFWYSTFADFF